MAETTSPAAPPTPAEAQRDWWPTGTRVALALVLLALLLAWAQSATFAIIFLLPAALALLIALLRPTARDWWIESPLLLAALLLAGWLVGAAVLWVVVNYHWAAQEQGPARDHTALTIDGVPLTAAVEYPSVALADAADNTLRFSFSADTPVALPRQTLTATVILSDTLAFALAGGPSRRSFAVPLTLGQPGSRRIAIVNSGHYGGWRGRAATIAIALCAPGGACVDDLALTVRPEGRQGYAARRFVTSTINQSSPIILLLLLAVPGLAVWAQKTLDGRQAARRKRRADECEQTIKRFRGYLCMRQMDRATAALQELDPTRYREHCAVERDLAHGLHALATLGYPLPDPADPRWDEWPEAWIVESGPTWPREFVAAAILAHERWKERSLETGYYDPALDFTLVHNALRRFLDEIWEACRAIHLDTRDRLYAKQQRINEQRLRDAAGRRPVLHAIPRPGYRLDDHRLSAPFAWGDASREEEIGFLRDGQAFWGNHPLLRRLRRGDHSLIVRGASGSGRTALARMLPLAYVNDPADLFVRIGRGDDRGAIVQAVARQLLQFARRQPGFLGSRSVAGQQRVANFLASWLRPGELEGSIRNRLDELAADEADGEARRERDKAHEELQRFRQLLPATPPTPPALDTTGWPDAFLDSANTLGYKNVVFVIGPEVSDLDWLSKLGSLQSLYEQGIHFWLFVDESFPGEPLIGLPRQVEEWPLAWKEDDRPYFRAMLEWRFEKYLDAANLWPKRERRRALGRCFADGEAGLGRLIDAAKVNGAYNPARFMGLWRDAAGEKRVDQPITAEDIDWAINSRASHDPA